MERWYAKVTSDPNNFFEPLGKAIEHYWGEYEEAQKEIKPARGTRIEDLASRIAGIMEYRYAQHQEIEMISRFVEMKYDIVKGEKKIHFLEHYNRSLSDKQADQHAEIEPDVIVLREFMQQIELIRNKFQGITKGIEFLHYQLSNITRLRVAGIEDATL